MTRALGDVRRSLALIPGEIWTFAALLFAWALLPGLLDVPEILFPALGTAVEDIASHPGLYLRATSETLTNTVIAFGISLVVGTALAVAVTSSRFLEKSLYSGLVALNNIPKVALAPLFVIWMGTGHVSKIAMGVFISIFAVVIDAVLGLRSLHRDMADLGHVLRGSRLMILFKLQLPNALPSILAGAKVAMSLSLVGALVGEFVAAQNGLGFLIMSAQGAFRTDRVFAAILILAVLGTVLFYAMDLVEAALIPWHESHRGRRRRAAAPLLQASGQA